MVFCVCVSHCRNICVWAGLGMVFVYYFFFFFKQKTAYEILTCDWSSDVCSSDLVPYLETGGSNVFMFRNRRFQWFPI